MKTKKWIPKVGEKVYYVTVNPNWTDTYCEVRTPFSADSTYKFNTFRTKKEAQLALNKIKKILK
jgi:hypothetical protein